MADNEEQDTNTSYKLFLRVISKRRQWVCLFLVVYAILLSSSWNSLNSIVNWYGDNHQTSSGWPAVYVSVLLGAVFGVQSMAAALFVAVPAIVVIWISLVVTMAFAGKSRKRVVIEGRKVTKEIDGVVFRVLLKEGNFVASFVLYLLTSSSLTLTLYLPLRFFLFFPLVINENIYD